MKTYHEIYSKLVFSDWFDENTTAHEVEEKAAKEFAKQWIQKVILEIADVVPDNTIAYYLTQIDAQ